MNVDEFFRQLGIFTGELTEEEERAIREGLSEEDLALFDILTRQDVELSAAERQQIKTVARELLDTLKAEKLVLDWRKRQQSRAAVRLCIEDYLDQLPDSYDTSIFEETVERTYQHVYDMYAQTAMVG